MLQYLSLRYSGLAHCLRRGSFMNGALLKIGIVKVGWEGGGGDGLATLL